ncbi:Abi-alpha family protein [Pseudonocardia sp. GCM10023141]|uniref:Abi-alpha family protein n=1 Tax=Pseudonocardia sp. GCM10023141 TaxID=3252653 RepID=UPI003622F9CD
MSDAPQYQQPEPEPNGVASDGSLSDLVRGAPRVDAADAIGMARVAGTVVWRAVNAVTRRSLGAATEIVREVQSGEPLSDIVDNQVEKARSLAVQALGLDGAPIVGTVSPSTRSAATRNVTAEDLRTIGNRMLRTSAYAANQPHDVHPAFAAMLSSLTPDEVRILRFLAVAGPQPSLDVRTRTPFGIGSERIAGGMNMIADMAGCSYPDHDHHYLANLNRLGLVRFSQEPVADFRRYSLIEAQPKVSDAMEKVKRATTVYRSIYLSLFGQQFCEACFDMTGYDAGGWADDDRGDKIIGKGPPKVKKKHHS